MGGTTEADARVSTMAGGLMGSEILTIAAEVRALQAQGSPVLNLTVGDFAPSEFPIPRFLRDAITDALHAGETNYPPPEGLPALRQAIVDFYRRRRGLEIPVESVLVGSGSRPGIYGTYRAVVDPGDRVVFPSPSWNNGYYVQMVGAEGVTVPCRADNAFLPTREALEPVIGGARLLVLNSPVNPTGTTFTPEGLGEICDLVLMENASRGPGERPLYVMYDQVYWMLTFGSTEHTDPISLRPEMEPFTILVDGASKSFAGTGLRVGWTVAPRDVTRRMSSILTHVGAWAPRAEQVAVARLLADDAVIDAFHGEMKSALQARLDALFAEMIRLRSAGHPVEAIAPMGAIYLSARFALHGRTTPEGQVLETDDQVRRYLLQAAGVAVVPFGAFGTPAEPGWFRLSPAASSLEAINESFPRLRAALEGLE